VANQHLPLWQRNPNAPDGTCRTNQELVRPPNAVILSGARVRLRTRAESKDLQFSERTGTHSGEQRHCWLSSRGSILHLL
jgi:hypothetical protein